VIDAVEAAGPPWICRQPGVGDPAQVPGQRRGRAPLAERGGHGAPALAGGFGEWMGRKRKGPKPAVGEQGDMHAAPARPAYPSRRARAMNCPVCATPRFAPFFDPSCSHPDAV